MKTDAELHQAALLGAENAANALRKESPTLLTLVSAETALRVAHAAAVRLVGRAKGHPEPVEGK
jgi:hypothetical protein